MYFVNGVVFFFIDDEVEWLVEYLRVECVQKSYRVYLFIVYMLDYLNLYKGVWL